MRIKRFNESSESEMIDFCNSHLAYLRDKGMVSVYRSDLHNNKYISLFIGRSSKRFNWVDIRDEYIPFLLLFNEKFNIDHIILFDYLGTNNPPSERSLHNDMRFSVENIINDEIPNDASFKSISIALEPNKKKN